MSANHIAESAINIVSEGTRIEGKMTFDSISRVHGILIGEVHSAAGSQLILSETAMVEGEIFADSLFIDGFVKGDVTAKTKVVISRTGRVLGNIHTPSLRVEFGGYFEGRCAMESEGFTSDRALAPV